jgi:hypothetical protein
VLYCGSWSQALSARHGAALQVADLATELRVRDEVARQVALIPATAGGVAGIDVAAREELREAYAELRRIGAEIADPSIRRRLGAVEERLASLTRDRNAPREPIDVPLAARDRRARLRSARPDQRRDRR